MSSMFYGAQHISQQLTLHLLLDLPFGCSDNIIVILLDNNNNNNNNRLFSIKAM